MKYDKIDHFDPRRVRYLSKISLVDLTPDLIKQQLLLWQFKTPECQVLVKNTGRVNVASIIKNLHIHMR